MSNPIKYSTGSESLALKTGNFYIGTGDVGKGPTSTTGYYNGITPPSGGYTIYLNKATGGPSIYTASNDAQLISLTNSIAGTSYTTANECLTYYLGQTDKVCFNSDVSPIVTNGLQLYVDGGYTISYPKDGTTWYDLSGVVGNTTLVNGATYTTNQGGGISFDGVNDRVTTNVSVLNWATESFTISSFFKWGSGGSSANYSFFELCGNGGSNWGMAHVPRSSSFYFYWINNTNNSGHVAYSDLIQDNVPLNVTITFNGVGGTSQQTLYDNTKIYINGNEISHQNAGSAGVNANSTLSIGGINYPMKGDIYNFMYYNRVLTSTEVSQNYNALKGRFGL